MIRDRASAPRTGAGEVEGPLPLLATEGSRRSFSAPHHTWLEGHALGRIAPSEDDLPPLAEPLGSRALRVGAAKRIALVRERRGAVDQIGTVYASSPRRRTRRVRAARLDQPITL